jgi:outer membrane protein TolC
MFHFILPLAILLLTASVEVGFAEDQSKDTSQEKYSVEGLVQRALNQSELLKSSKYRTEEKRFSAQQAKAWQNPEISLSGGRKQASPQDPSEPTQSGLLYEGSISQPFFFPGKQKLRGEIGNLEADVAQVKANETELLIATDVVRLSYEYEINQRKKDLAENRQKRFELIQTYLSGHVFASPQQKAERLIVERRVHNLATEALRFRAALKAAYEKLNLYVSWEKEAVPKIDVPWVKGAREIDKSAWATLIQERNFNLLSQRLLVLSAEKENRLAKRQNIPDFSIFGSYAQEKAGDTEQFLKGGISFPIPILNQNRGGIKSTARRIEAENALLRFNEQQLQSQLGQLYGEYQVARETVTHYPEGALATLENQLRDMEREFRKGRVNLITFLELDSEVGETYERTLDAQLNLLDKLLALSFLAGDREFISRISEF